MTGRASIVRVESAAAPQQRIDGGSLSVWLEGLGDRLKAARQQHGPAGAANEPMLMPEGSGPIACTPEPYSAGMDGGEHAAHMARRALFQQLGAAPKDAETAADTLALRDHADDERRMCLECVHLLGIGPYRCGNFRVAGFHAPGLARTMAQTLQHCPAHKAAQLPMGAQVDDAPPAPEKEAAPQTFDADQSASAWTELDRAYLAHHAGCQSCKGAGRGYGARCAVGAQLWASYTNATINRQ